MNTVLSQEWEPPAKKYAEKLTNLSNTFYSVLDDFKKYYVLYHKNPEVDEYQRYFENSKFQLQDINKEVSDITIQIEHSISKINDILIRVNAQITSEKELKSELDSLMGSLQNSLQGSNTMESDTSLTYSKQYYKNIEIVIGIILVLGFIGKAFQQVPPQNS